MHGEIQYERKTFLERSVQADWICLCVRVMEALLYASSDEEKKKNQYDEICSRHGDSELWPVLDKVKEVYTAMEILPFVFAPLMAKGVMLFVLNDFLPLNQAYRFVAFILLYIIFVPFFEELVHLSLVAKFNSLSKRCNRARKNNSDTM